MTLALYANGHGSRIGSELPIGTAGRLVRGRSLSGDATEAIDASGQVSIQSTGGVRDLEGIHRYPESAAIARGRGLAASRGPSAFGTRTSTRDASSNELRSVGRFGFGRRPSAGDDRRRTADIRRRVADTGGWRAITIEALIPTGLYADETVVLSTDATDVEGSFSKRMPRSTPVRASETLVRCRRQRPITPQAARKAAEDD
ncbi:hypothetical protein D8S78_03490 [Natrialba swarupiae]|nr:hypothetical protein [Natrialba swarupiae]